MLAIAPRHHLGLVLPAVPAPRGQRQETLILEPSATLPRGYCVEETAAGLQLIRERDGARLGVMPSLERAGDYAAALARMEAQRQPQEDRAA